MTSTVSSPAVPHLVSPEEVSDPVVKQVYAEIERELGFGIVPNVFRAMADHPSLLESNWHMFRAIVLSGRLPRILKEMIGVVVSAAHDSTYARLVHLHSLGVQGISAGALAALSEGAVEAEELSPTTVAVLRFAQRVAQAPNAPLGAAYTSLAEVGLDAAEVLEVLGTIQLFTAVNLFTDAAGVPVDAI